jgi:hypothetical protein
VQRVKNKHKIYMLSVFYKDLHVYLCMYFFFLCMYVGFCLYACVCTCLLLCTSFIDDEELYRWIVGLDDRLLHFLIAMICALPLQTFLYFVFMYVEFKGNPFINCIWILPTSLGWCLTSDIFDLSLIWSWIIAHYFWDCDSEVACVELLLQSL